MIGPKKREAYTLNGFGTQAPNTGSGYAGLYSGDTGPNVKEGLIQDILPTGGYLTAGKVYYAEMFASLAETSGLATTMGWILTDGTSSFAYQSYCYPTNITSKTTWTRISTCFTATGNESDIWISANTCPIAPVAVVPASGYAFSGALPFNYAYYYIDDVSIKPLVEAGSDQTICALNTTIGNIGCPALFGVTNNWTVTGPAGVTIATPTSPVTNVTFTTAGTYTFTLTATYGSCTATDVAVVTVAPVPTAAVASPATICVGSSSTLTASGATTYSWSGGPATATYTVTPLVTTTYTVTGTTGGCSSTATVTVTVDPTCCPGTYVVPPAGTTSSVFGTSFAATTIALNGNWTIDVNTIISNNTIVYCAPNTKIIIPSGRVLTINKSSLYSCGLQMWDGIEIQPGGNLIITNKSLIEDAKIAVWSNNAGGVANFTIDKTTFNRNYIGVKVENYSGTLHPGRIRNSTFGSAASVTSTTNTAFLDSPYSAQTAEDGVYLFNVNQVQIGDAALPSYQNEFIYLRIGIRADGSNYIAYNNFFHNGYLSTLCVSCPLAGWAIWNNKTKAVIGGAAANQPNKFKDITNGILHENGTYLDAFYNTFLNMIYSFPHFNGGTAIYTRNFTQSGAIRIAYNDIKDVKTGLFHQNNFVTSYGVLGNLFKNFNSRGIYCLQNNSGTISIASNDFNQSATSVYTGNIGIEISNAVIGLGASPVINVNSNTIFRMNKGILLNTVSKKPTVKNNIIQFKSTLTLPPNFYYGIRSLNSEGEYIYQNAVTKGGTDPTSAFENSVYGISVETNQTSTSVLENNTQKLGTGLRFRSYTNANSDIRCNIMNRNFAGLGLDNVRVGDQGLPATITPPFPGDAADNSWTNPALVTSSVSVRGAGLTSPFDAFYTRSAAYPWCPSNASIVPTNSILDANTVPSITPVPGAPTNCSNLCGTPPYPICMHSPSLAKIARNEAPFDAVTGTLRYTMHEGILRGVLSDSIPLDTTTVDGLDLKTFIDNELVNTTVGQLVNVGIKHADGDTTGAMALNASVITTSCVDDYHKIVNGIFFNTWGIGNFTISSADSTTLYNIAIQDPLNCGTAIYDARVMLGIDINDYSTPGHRMDPFDETPTAVEDKIGVLYPNPAHSSCTYEATLTDAQSGFIMMYDLSGKLLQSYKLNSGDNKLEMDLSGFANGVYMYQIVINGETLEHKKLVISK